MKTVNIIGAGPAGNYLAYLLAGKFNVNVFEEHKEAGKPVHCTGIITNKIFQILNVPEDVIVNRVDRIRIHSRKKTLEINLKKPDIIVDRAKFDKFLFEIARKKGAKYYFNHKLIGIKDKLIFEKKIVEKNILVGADGANSLVSKSIGNRHKYYMGVQARVKIKQKDVDVFLNAGKFGWVVPEGNGICRMGVFSDLGNARNEFKKFVRKQPIEIQGGLIPIYNSKEIFQKGNTYVIGDAGSLVKATTGGGIVPGLMSAKILADCLINNRRYAWELRNVRLELWLHLLLRRVLNNLEEKDAEKIIQIFGKKKNKKKIENVDRDSIGRMIFLLLKPRLVYLFLKGFMRF